jgi:hypothetical protein
MPYSPILSCYLAHAISEPLRKGPYNKLWTEHYYDVCIWASRLAELNIVANVPVLLPTITHAQALRIDHFHVSSVDFIVIHESKYTAASTGVKQEIRWAKAEDIPVVYSLDEAKKLKKQMYKEMALV